MNAGFGRRVAALLYDSLLIAALVMIYTALALLFTHGKAIEVPSAGAWVYVYRAGLIAVIAGYYILCCHGTGHTLGMRAWRLRVQSSTGLRVSMRAAGLRFVLGLLAWIPCGLGVLWLYVDRNGLALQDRVSGTRLVVLQ